MYLRRERIFWGFLLFLFFSWSSYKIINMYRYKPPDLRHVHLDIHSFIDDQPLSNWVVVMPIITKEVIHMKERFSEWSFYAPCDSHHEEQLADLIFFHHQTVDKAFIRTISELITLYPMFFRCFANVHAVSARLPPEEDGYPAGPNAMFYRLMLSDNILTANKYEYMLYFEQDMTIIRSNWLTDLQKESSQRNFLILGSLPLHPAHPTCLSCNLHINGNAVYHLGAELRELVKRTYISGGIFGYAYDQQFAKYLFEHCMPDEKCNFYFSQTWPRLLRTESMLNAWNQDWCVRDVHKKYPKAALVHGGYNNVKNHSNVIAISLWGNNPRFHAQLLKNLQDGWFRVFPCWKVRVYTTRLRNTDLAALEKLEAAGAEIIIAEDHPELDSIKNPMMWRFAVASDPSVDRFLIRDADTVVIQRDADAVNEWIESGKPFHIIRDHPAHCYHLPQEPIMGGMWGGTKDAVPQMMELISGWAQLDKQFNDQLFLTEHILILALQHGALNHDSACCDQVPNTIGLPTPRRSVEYVGCYVGSDGECSLGGHTNKCPDRNLPLKPSFGELRRREDVYYRTLNTRLGWLTIFLLSMGIWTFLKTYYGTTCNCRSLRHRWLQAVSACRRSHNRADR